MKTAEPSSFRDNAGFIFRDEGVVFRQVSEPYRPHWEALKSSGLLDQLQSEGRLIHHEEIPFDPIEAKDAIAVLQPEAVPFISYPYEWCFSELKDAALCTLGIQRRALERGFILKDASAFNIQFVRGKPALIDTLSFEIYEEGRPWQAYRQFCRHFLAPLALMAHVDPSLGMLLRPNLDGVSLEMAAKALPFRDRLKPGLAINLFMHAKAESKSGQGSTKTQRVSKAGLMGLMESLESTIRSLVWKPAGTVWGDYYDDTNYSNEAMGSKKGLVSSFLESRGKPFRSVWDLGANTGVFSALAAETSDHVIAWDVDPAAVEKHYLQTRASQESKILPLIQDLTNPSPGIGWDNTERASLKERANADLVLALALIHHLAIGNNLPLSRIASFLQGLAPLLIIEYAPKEDSQVQRMLSNRADIFSDYTQMGFEDAFQSSFRTVRKEEISGTRRTLYLMERLSNS